MPRSIDAESTEECALGDCVEAMAQAGFDPDCEELVAHGALWLRKLCNNRTFLGDLLVDQLRQGASRETIESDYSPQAIVLSPTRRDVFLRANIWPSARDQCFHASGAKTFVYGVPHDHNFSFLTCGYFGPGYRTDYYEYDYGSVAGYAGERPDLRFVERSALGEGKLMLYRAHQDIHSQIPPESLSVSINIMHVAPAQRWFDQYGFDLERGTITRVLSPNATEVFLRLAVATGIEEAIDLAETFARSHPSDRLRLASYEARAGLCTGAGERDRLWRDAEISGSEMVRQVARQQRARLDREQAAA